MTQPAYVIPAGFKELPVVTDVLEIIDDLDNTIVAIDGWVEGPAETFTSPVDAAGRFYKLTFLRFGATELHVTLTDDQGRASSTKRVDITGGGQTITFFHSPRYLYIVVYGTNEYMQSSLLTLDPESETAHTAYTIFNCRQTTAASSTASGTNRWEQIDASNVYSDEIDTLFLPETRNGAIMEITRHVSGAIRFFPAINIGDDTGTLNVRGRIYNALVVLDGIAAAGVEITVPINDGQSAVFKALNMDILDSLQYLVRKS